MTGWGVGCMQWLGGEHGSFQTSWDLSDATTWLRARPLPDYGFPFELSRRRDGESKSVRSPASPRVDFELLTVLSIPTESR